MSSTHATRCCFRSSLIKKPLKVTSESLKVSRGFICNEFQMFFVCMLTEHQSNLTSFPAPQKSVKRLNFHQTKCARNGNRREIPNQFHRLPSAVTPLPPNPHPVPRTAALFLEKLKRQTIPQTTWPFIT